MEIEVLVKVFEKLRLVLVSGGNDFRILDQKLFEKWREERKREERKLVREGKYYKIYQSGTYTWVSLSDPHGMAELLFCIPTPNPPNTPLRPSGAIVFKSFKTRLEEL